MKGVVQDFLYNQNILYQNYSMIEKQNQETVTVFKDISKNGKDRQWRERKLRNIDLAKRLERLGFRSFQRVYQCAEVLKFVEQTDGTCKLYQSYFCKNRLCSLCNWRRSMKYSYQAELVVNKALEEYPKGRFLFLTLTIKNVEGKELNQAISKISEAFRRLMMYKRVDKNVLGYLRATEVTYSDEKDNYHPHLHVLLMVKPNYFSGRGDNYISQEEWTNLWAKAMKLDYKPVVDIRAVKPKKENQTDKDGLKKAILETAKYPVKPFDYQKDKDGNVIDLTENQKDSIVDDMMSGLHAKRLIGFGKLFKVIKNQLELDSVEEGDFVNVGEEDGATSTGREVIAIWNWERKNYFLK